jgi:hypothetical protein
MPYCSNANQVPVRPQPVCTSSTTSGMSSSRAIVAIRCTNSTGAGIEPPSPWTSSRMIAAGRCTPPWVSRSVFTSRSAQFVEQLAGARLSGQRWQ